jgi:hypothetical protein
VAALAILDERSGSMKLSEFTEEQTVYIIRQAEIGAPIRHRSSLEHLTVSDFISQRQNENNRPPKTCSARFAQLSLKLPPFFGQVVMPRLW